MIAAKAAAAKAARADAGRSRCGDELRAKSAGAAPTRACSVGKKSSRSSRPAQPPRRELARVLRAAASWAQLADALKDEEAKAAATPADKAAVFLELADAYGKLNNDNQVMAALNSAVQADPTLGEAYDRLAALYEAKKRWPDLVKVLQEKADRSRSTAPRRSRSISRSRTCTSSGSRTRPRRSRRSRRSSRSIRTTSKRSITCSRSTRSVATGKS